MNADPSSPDSVPTAPGGTPPLVLIIDDSRVMRAALSRLLSKRYRVLEAEDGDQGWETIREQADIELVFCDLSMPRVDGFEVLRRVRDSDDKAIASLPFVVITGHEDDEGMQRKAAAMGASDFVSKPFRSAEITTRAKTLIGQRRDMRRLYAELDARATRDAVTGLSDRAHFAAHLDAVLSLALRHGLDSACLALALDDHAGLAARLGPSELEHLLADLAGHLQAITRSEDAVGYLGDGRFAVALIGAGPHGAERLARRLAARLKTAAGAARTAPTLSMGVSTPVSADSTSAAQLLDAALACLAPLPAEPEPRAPAQPDTTAAEIESVLSRVESVLSQGNTASEATALREELEQARTALTHAEQANAHLAKELKSLQDAARQQVAKAHREMAKIRSQLTATQTQFRDYMQQHPRDAREQAETELAQLRAVLAERDEQLAAEGVLRRQAQEMVGELQKRVTEYAEQQAAGEASRGRLLSRLLGR